MSIMHHQLLAIIHQEHENWQNNGLGNLTVQEMIHFYQWIRMKECEWFIQEKDTLFFMPSIGLPPYLTAEYKKKKEQ